MSEEELLNIAKELSEKPTTELALQFMELTADNIVKDKQIDRLNNIINELEKWLKQRYKKTEENSSRMKYITSLNKEFYITVKNVQADRKDILDKLKELKENK